MIAQSDLIAIRGRLSATSGIPLELVEIQVNGGRLPALRPAGLPLGSGFSIALSSSLHTAEAAVVVDRYGGRFLRQVGDGAVADPEPWWEAFEEAVQRGIRVWIEVNGSTVSWNDPPLETWTSLTLEFSCRVNRVSTVVAEVLTRLAALCLGCVTAALETARDLLAEEPGELIEEGAARRVVETRYERSPVNRMRCIDYYGEACWVCDFEFKETYGDLGAGFIVVHHTTPVSQVGDGYKLDPVAELVPLCANCHYMVHKLNPPMPPEQLRNLLNLPEKSARPVKKTQPSQRDRDCCTDR